MLQTFIELYRYTEAWTGLTDGERDKFTRQILGSAGELQAMGIEVVAYGVNDPDTDRRAPYDFFCVYRVPDLQTRRVFEKAVEGSGWYRYFDQVNLSGAALTPFGLFAANARLEEPAVQAEEIAPQSRYTKRSAVSHGHSMSYAEHGEGRAIVLLHGDVMSSFLWRNVMPHLEGRGRLLAVDLVGAGDSEKLPGSGEGTYSFAEHARHLDGLLDALDVGDDVVLVGHDWGANLAFDWAMRHPGRTAGIAFSEALTPPFDWEDWPESVQPLFRFLRTPEGEQAVLQHNAFVDSVPRFLTRVLAPEEHAEIARPYAEPGEGRRPTIDWPRQVPFGDDDTPVRAQLEQQAAWLATSPVPKLFLRAHPGGIAAVGGRRADGIRWYTALTEAHVTGSHWVPEEDPHGVGRALAHWLDELPAR
ncbi:haloalkane dehalogenase [Pseudonocardia alaniniphila]|uniref:Haloalkane dehalogenase n=1 Tax=Pseudonocardia alaniniphila TaxID=75291 RepID=A0ABS9TGJ5_9PSEU|nr:haloalkane dehalogenase [Pseudonocardia alaniniphila]MCH6167659.1 haloalkane dehalogenase [Pseudonocardia alaniniphila]